MAPRMRNASGPTRPLHAPHIIVQPVTVTGSEGLRDSESGSLRENLKTERYYTVTLCSSGTTSSRSLPVPVQVRVTEKLGGEGPRLKVISAESLLMTFSS